MDRSLTIDKQRQEYVERSKQRALDYLDQGDVRNAVASFVSSMNDRPDCRLPHHLAALGVLLLMANDALGRGDLLTTVLGLNLSGDPMQDYFVDGVTTPASGGPVTIR